MFELETLTDVIALLKTAEARDNGVEERVFHRSGILSLDGVAVELRRRGYEVELFEAGGGSTDTSPCRPFGRRTTAQGGPALLPRAGTPQTPSWPLRGSSLTPPPNPQEAASGCLPELSTSTHNERTQHV